MPLNVGQTVRVIKTERGTREEGKGVVTRVSREDGVINASFNTDWGPIVASILGGHSMAMSYCKDNPNFDFPGAQHF